MTETEIDAYISKYTDYLKRQITDLAAAVEKTFGHRPVYYPLDQKYAFLPSRTQSGIRRRQIWGMKYPHCVICKKTREPYLAKGMCAYCYESPAQRKLRDERWQQRHGKTNPNARRTSTPRI